MALSDTVVVKVGKQEKCYTLYRAPLVEASGFFRGALSGNFKESTEGLIRMKDVNTDVFDAVVDWIYQGVLLNNEEYRDLDKDTRRLTFHIYVTADKLLIPGLKVAVFERRFNYLNTGTNYIDYTSMTNIFNSLGHFDPYLQLAIDTFYVNNGIRKTNARDEYIGNREGLFDDIQKLPHAVLASLLLKSHDVEGLSANKRKLKREDYKI
ncbi:hypothetical protein GQ44DRAFT_607415 [Phaeosphaeriaceae sp. PMI808]|nr:hypothetical protein GQ44DRAFT_607415 [Phaeosphaeriaceae sp. PMI808]